MPSLLSARPRTGVYLNRRSHSPRTSEVEDRASHEAGVSIRPQLMSLSRNYSPCVEELLTSGPRKFQF